MRGPFLLISINECHAPYPVFPLGVAHLAAALGRAGYAVEILDMNLDGAELESRVQRIAPSAIGLSLRNIDDVKIDNTAFFAPALAQVSSRIRAVSTAPLIVGGSGFSLFPARLLAECGADFGVWGEGEAALVQLLDSLESGGDPAGIAGLVYRRPDGTVAVNPRQALTPGEVPAALRPARLVEFYQAQSAMVNLQTQRGCGYTCCYCTYPLIEGSRFRRRDGRQVCDEIEAAQKAGARYFFIVDSVFNTSPDHVTAICEEILRRGLKIQWGCFLRPQNCTEELLGLMAAAGLKHVEFGTDSLCDEVLQAYGKGFTVADVIQASQAARKARVHYAHFLIIGGPGETEATIHEGFANSQKIPRTVFFPFIGMRIYPDTPLYEYARSHGVIAAQDDLLAPVFYVTPHVAVARMQQLLADFQAQAKNWIVGELDPQLTAVMQGLRAKGIPGPLWEYLAR